MLLNLAEQLVEMISDASFVVFLLYIRQMLCMDVVSSSPCMKDGTMKKSGFPAMAKYKKAALKKT